MRENLSVDINTLSEHYLVRGYVVTENFLGVCHAIEARGWRGDKQVLLLFTSERIIIMRKGWLADIAGSGVGVAAGGVILQGILSVADSASQKRKAREIGKEDFDQLIEKRNHRKWRSWHMAS